MTDRLLDEKAGCSIWQGGKTRDWRRVARALGTREGAHGRTIGVKLTARREPPPRPWRARKLEGRRSSKASADAMAERRARTPSMAGARPTPRSGAPRSSDGLRNSRFPSCRSARDAREKRPRPLKLVRKDSCCRVGPRSHALIVLLRRAAQSVGNQAKKTAVGLAA